MTEIHPLDYDFGQNNQFHIMRDDLLPFSFGGNKARKAKLFFNDLDQGDYDCVVTYGSSSSNHCRIVSNVCVMRSLPCYIISPLEASAPTFNSKLIELFQAHITTVPVSNVHDTIETKLEDLRKNGNKPYFIPGGGHGLLGTQAFVDCYEEIRAWEQENRHYFDYIFHASGTGTTQAGLICGQLIHQDSCSVIGISVARKNPYGRDVIIASIKEYLLHHEINIDDQVVEKYTIFLDQYVGNGYGQSSESIEEAIYTCMKKYGIPFDRTYTGKAFVGMKHYLKEKQIHDKNILFIHTGGTPLFFDTLLSAI